jgi:hypothetical protein
MTFQLETIFAQTVGKPYRPNNGCDNADYAAVSFHLLISLLRCLPGRNLSGSLHPISNERQPNNGPNG